MTTCEPAWSGGEDGEPLTLFAADSLASPSASRGRASRKQTNGGSGQLSTALFALLIPDSSSSRTLTSFCPQGRPEPSAAAYVAGLVDGDGSIWIQPGRTTQLYPKISIRLGWKGRDTLTELHRWFGGYMGQEKRPDNAKHSAVFHWTAVGRTAVPVLQAIYPYLRIKRAQAAVALHLAAIWASGDRDRYMTGRRLQELMRVLNQTGPEFALPVVGRWLLVPELTSSRGKLRLRFLKTWPRAGAIANGIAYRRPPSAPLTGETVSGFLPTPTVGDSRNSRNATANRSPGSAHHSGTTLADYVTMWPTPSARDWRSGKASEATMARNSRPLNEVVVARETWPTPVASDAGKDRGSSAGWGLRNAVRQWPTPTANRWDGLQSHVVNAITGALNPTWVEWLMGYPPGWTDCGD